MRCLIVLTALALLASAARAQTLSDAQRIAVLRDIDAQFGLPYVEPGSPQDHQTLDGAIRTADGSALPANFVFFAYSRRTRPSEPYWAPESETKLDVKDGHFHQQVPFGFITLVPETSNYAPIPGYAQSWFGPLLGTPGGTLDKINLVLDPGFAASIKVTDPKGKPIPTARLTKASYLNCQRCPWLVQRSIAADAAGIITIPHCRDWPVDIYITADGYQNLRDPGRYWPGHSCRLSAKEPVTIILHPAKPATGRAVLASTHKPVAAAQVKEFAFSASGSGGMGSSSSNGDVLATTDKDGNFSLASLEDGATYGVVVETPDGSRAILKNVKAGETGIKAELIPSVTARGTVTGPLDGITVNGKMTVKYWAEDSDLFQWPQSGIGGPVGYRDYPRPTDPVAVEARDGVGQFKIEKLHHGYMVIAAAGANFIYDIDGTHDQDIEIQLPPKPEQMVGSPVYRTAIINLLSSDRAPPPEGFIRVESYWDYTAYHSWTTRGEHYLPLAGGQAHISIPIPNSPATVYPGDLLGYTFDKKTFEVSDGGFFGQRGVLTLAQQATTPVEVRLALQPAGAIYGTIPAEIPLSPEISAVPPGEIPPNENYEEFEMPAILNPVRHTYVIPALPLGVHYKVLARVRAGSDVKVITMAEDVLLGTTHVASRVDLGAAKLPSP